MADPFWLPLFIPFRIFKYQGMDDAAKLGYDLCEATYAATRVGQGQVGDTKRCEVKPNTVAKLIGALRPGRAMYLFYFFLAAGFVFLGGSWFHAFLLLCFSALCFSAFCFSCFSACLLLCFSASLLLCFCAFLLLLLYLCLFFSHVSCCSTSWSFCSSASLLPVFTTSLFCSFSFALFSPVGIPNETLKTLGETRRNLKEFLIRTPDKNPLHETLNEP